MGTGVAVRVGILVGVSVGARVRVSAARAVAVRKEELRVGVRERRSVAVGRGVGGLVAVA